MKKITLEKIENSFFKFGYVREPVAPELKEKILRTGNIYTRLLRGIVLPNWETTVHVPISGPLETVILCPFTVI